MRSHEPSPGAAPGTSQPALAQEDEHAGWPMHDPDDTAPVVVLDWQGLLEGGTPPCLALGAERRTRKRD